MAPIAGGGVDSVHDFSIHRDEKHHATMMRGLRSEYNYIFGLAWNSNKGAAVIADTGAAPDEHAQSHNFRPSQANLLSEMTYPTIVWLVLLWPLLVWPGFSWLASLLT